MARTKNRSSTIATQAMPLPVYQFSPLGPGDQPVLLTLPRRSLSPAAKEQRAERLRIMRAKTKKYDSDKLRRDALRNANYANSKAEFNRYHEWDITAAKVYPLTLIPVTHWLPALAPPGHDLMKTYPVYFKDEKVEPEDSKDVEEVYTRLVEDPQTYNWKYCGDWEREDLEEHAEELEEYFTRGRVGFRLNPNDTYSDETDDPNSLPIAVREGNTITFPFEKPNAGILRALAHRPPPIGWDAADDQGPLLQAMSDDDYYEGLMFPMDLDL
jgi:hypothetical protein